MESLNRRQFLVAGGALTATALVRSDAAADPLYLGAGTAPFIAGCPVLQAPAETTMGVSWAVSGLAKGEVEIADNPDLRGSRRVKCGGLGLVPIDPAALQVRLTGLKPSTTYWYRTITTPFTDYRNIYEAKLGTPVASSVYSFMTPGPATPAHFCMICDTHAHWETFAKIAAKVKTLAPSVIVWNGDATNTTQDKTTAVEIFLDPPVAAKDFAAGIPLAFESGNHDFRGSWISRKEEVMLPRAPAERSSSEADLKWNFAVRLGALALIGLDTGEDKPDAHPKWFGLANFEPYRRAQRDWLERVLARPDIAAAEMKVVFCHIPLHADPKGGDYAHDGVKVDPQDYAYWSRECRELWGPLLDKAGVKLVVCGHRHRYRHDWPEDGRAWHQVVGGGPENDVPNGRFPTVVEGRYAAGKLTVNVYDAANGRLADSFDVASV